MPWPKRWKLATWRIFAVNDEGGCIICTWPEGHEKPVIPLRFSKSGNLEIEKWYATHFVDTKRIAVLKAQHPVENLD